MKGFSPRATLHFFAATMLLPTPLASQAAEDITIEEVVVTARKREESLQEVPVAVSAFNTESMESLGIQNLRDFDGLVPGLHMGGGGNGLKGDGNAYIRGIGQRETRVTIDSGVGIYLDDVYIARSSGALLDAVEIQSVQVLRGPQGTLFGKNTTGGAILYTSIKPSEEFGGNVKTSVGNYGLLNGSISMNIPLIEDTLLSRLTLAHVGNDGYTENDLDGTNWTDDDRNMAVAQLRWLPSDALIVDLNFNYTKTDQKPNSIKCKWLGEELADAGFPGPANLEFLYDLYSDVSVEESCKHSGEDLPIDEFQSEQNSQSDVFYQASYEVETSMASATINWEINENLQLKSITAYRNTEQVADEDIDAMAAALVGRYAPENNDTDQYSQELQFIGSAFNTRLNYTLGAYAFYEKTNDDWIQDYAGYNDNTTVPNNILLARSLLHERETENTAYAGFGQLDFDITERIILTLGIRYTWEERKTSYKEASVYLPSIGNGDYLGGLDTIYGVNLLHAFSEPGGTPFQSWQYGYDPDGLAGAEPFEIGSFGTAKDDRNDDDWTPMASIKFLASDSVLEALRLDNAMSYLTYSSGFRSGGVTVANGDFDDDGIYDLENFKPETVDMYELGFKIDALNRRLRANIAIYYQEYNDIQLTTTVQDPNLGVPLPAIDNAGEAEIKGVETELTFLPTNNLRFTGSVSYMDAEYKEYIADVPDPNGPGLITTDRSDEPMPRAPEWMAFLSTDYFIFTDSMGTFTPNFVIRYTDEIYGGFDRASFYVQDEINTPSETFYDARVTWQSPEKKITVAAWCKNLTDKDDHQRGGVPVVSTTRTAGAEYSIPRTYGLNFTYRFGAQ
jgi:iron complex outermembrane receptor protein